MRLKSPPSILAAALCLLVVSSGAAAEERELLGLVTELGATLEWDPLRGLGVISAGDDRIALAVGVPFAVVDYAVKVDIDAPFMREGAVYLTTGAAAALGDAVGKQRLARAMERLRIGSVLIDPGHGGRDPGAVGKYAAGKSAAEVREKDVVLAVAKELGRKLAAEYPDKQVLYTRSDDTYITLEDRAEMANALLAKSPDRVLYISVHANSTMSRVSKPTGFEVWYLPPSYRRTLLEGEGGGVEEELVPILNSMLEEEITVESIVLARDILEGLGRSVGTVSPSRGLKEESWYVVRNAKMPAVLIEVGFISTPEEAARLADPAYLRDVAEGIYSGVRAFISRFERGGSPRVQ